MTKKDETRAAIAATKARLKEVRQQHHELWEENCDKDYVYRRKADGLLHEERALNAKLAKLRDSRDYVTVAEVTDPDGHVHAVEHRRNDPTKALVYRGYATNGRVPLEEAMKEADRMRRYLQPQLDAFAALILLTAKH